MDSEAVTSLSSVVGVSGYSIGCLFDIKSFTDTWKNTNMEKKEKRLTSVAIGAGFATRVSLITRFVGLLTTAGSLGIPALIAVSSFFSFAKKCTRSYYEVKKAAEEVGKAAKEAKEVAKATTKLDHAQTRRKWNKFGLGGTGIVAAASVGFGIAVGLGAITLSGGLVTVPFILGGVATAISLFVNRKVVSEKRTGRTLSSIGSSTFTKNGTTYKLGDLEFTEDEIALLRKIKDNKKSCIRCSKKFDLIQEYNNSDIDQLYLNKGATILNTEKYGAELKKVRDHIFSAFRAIPQTRKDGGWYKSTQQIYIEEKRKKQKEVIIKKLEQLDPSIKEKRQNAQEQVRYGEAWEKHTYLGDRDAQYEVGMRLELANKIVRAMDGKNSVASGYVMDGEAKKWLIKAAIQGDKSANAELKLHEIKRGENRGV
jgi:hypothetical protein